MEYIVIHEPYQRDFEQRMNEIMEQHGIDNIKLVGGVSVTQTNIGVILYSQALLIPKKDK